MRFVILILMLLTGCGPSARDYALTWEQAQVLAKRCESKGLLPHYIGSIGDGTNAAHYVYCRDPKTGAIFRLEQE